MNNTLYDLNNYLFESLENIENADNDKELKKELEKAKVKAIIADKIIDNAKTVLSLFEYTGTQRNDVDKVIGICTTKEKK